METIIKAEKTTLEQNRIPTAFLRGLGAIVIIIASAIYLYQSGESITPYQRHWIFLGVTALFGGLTWITGGVLKEMKGARSFIALAVASVPVLLTQIGAMLHSLLVGQTVDMPETLVFSAGNGSLFGLVAALTLAVAVPVTLFGNRILVRSRSREMSIIFLISNALLLFTARSLVPVGILLTLSVGALLWYAVTHFKNDPAVRTKEGAIALTTLFIPQVIIAVRTLIIYDQGPIFTGLIWMLSGIVAVVLPMDRSSVRATALQVGGGVAVVVGWITALSSVSLATDALEYYLLALPAGAIISGISFALKGGSAIALRRLAALIFAGALLFGQMLFFGGGAVMATIIGGAALIAAAAKMGEKTPLFMGVIAVSIGLIGIANLLFTALSGSTWLILMAGGILIILGASFAEALNNRWKGEAAQLKERVAAWH